MGARPYSNLNPMKSNTITIDPTAISTKELHGILLTAVAPRPIAFASTIDTEGNVNLSPFSFFNVFSANPPIIVFSPARRVRDNTIKHTLENAIATKEVVINIVNYAMVEQMSLASTEYDTGVDEFDKAGFTAIPSDLVKPPRVSASPISFECIIENIVALGQEGGAGNLIIAKVVKIHLNRQYLDENNHLDTAKLDLVARLGGNWYARITKDNLFEIPKPIFTKGIGVDQLPAHTRNSSILTGNNLGRLGNSEQLPSEKSVRELKATPSVKSILKINDPIQQEKELHILAKKFLDEGNLEGALTVLFCI